MFVLPVESSCLEKAPALVMGVTSAVLLESSRGCKPGAWPCPTLVLVGRLKSKLNPFDPAVVVLVFGKPKVNLEDVVGSSDRFPEVRVKSAPANVLASEVCVDVSPLDEETW